VPPAAGAEKKSKYETMIVGIGSAHAETHDKLEKLADSLGVKPGAVVWHAVEALLKNPPKAGDIKAVGRTGAISVGSAPGFWVKPLVKDGKTNGLQVVEVAKRGDITDGRAFFRFTVADTTEETTKARTRALKQAIRAAEYDAKTFGVAFDGKAVELPAAKKA
jgi:uncharacterized protein YggE